VRVLVVGDSYMPASIFTAAFAGLNGSVTLTELQVQAGPAGRPLTASAAGLREYEGDPAAVAAAVTGHDVLVVHGAPVTAEVLDAAPLRLVCCARGGPVNVDVAAATARGIPVACAPGRNARAVAELTVAFALALIRGVPAASRRLLAGMPLGDSNFEGGEFIGAEAASTALGLVGLGHVGREVAVLAQALGFGVLGYDPVLPGDVPPGVRVMPLEDLLGQADIVSLHARATADNRNLIGAAAFARMHRGSFLINTARDSLVDEDALRQALISGHLAGAALDVAARPPDGASHPLLELPNVLLAPHIGGATHETLRRGAELTVAAVARIAAGLAPDHVVNPQVLAGQAGAS
jgi:D-3-phosphoglycerate dehydrogenase / 2-oxoglutarate reductase